MVHLMGITDIDPNLTEYLETKCNVSDSAFCLPTAHTSVDSGALKGVTLRLVGDVSPVSPDLFSQNWFCGVTVVKIPNDAVERLVSTSEQRKDTLNKLVECTHSETQDIRLKIGPTMMGDSHDNDTGAWMCGFDGPGCCVGIYSASANKAPNKECVGMNRAHRNYYILCKAGAGVAGQTFHSHFTASLNRGATLDEALGDGGTPGRSALYRLGEASRRNRGRIIASCCEKLELDYIDSLPDNMSPPGCPYRLAVPHFECTYNSIYKLDISKSSVWQYASGTCDANVSRGCE